MSRRRRDEITSSHTATESGELLSSPDELLGDSPLRKAPELRLLVRLTRLPSDDVRDQWGLRGLAAIERPVVVGPIAAGELRALFESKRLDPLTELLASPDRWKPARLHFPDIEELQLARDLTQTATGVTNTATATLASQLNFDDEMGPSTNVQKAFPTEDTPTNEDFLEGYSAEESPPEPEASASSSLPPEADALAVEKRARARALGARPRPAPPPTAASRPVLVAAPRRANAPAATPWIVAAVVGVALAGLWFYRTPRPAAPTVDASVREGLAAQNWPEILRPRGEESLYAGESQLLQKIRPILRAYERGVTVLSASDETTLRQVADPGTADWDARRIASNQLAVFLLARLETEAAQEILNPVLEASPDDFPSLVNRALIRLAESEVKDARRAAEASLATCAPTGLCWVGHAILGLVESAEGDASGVDRAFQAALAQTSSNPFVYGLYIHSLLRIDPKGGPNIGRLMRDALASDPDRLVDSPIPAPIAGHILLSQALEGLRQGGELPPSKLTPGQRAYLRWLNARFRSNPLGEPQSRVEEILAGESAPLSRVLYAYLLRRQKRFELASTTLGETLTNLDGELSPTSSWPWTLAADLQFEQSRIDSAILYYQQAIARNPRDVAALHGLALVFRGKNDVIAAEARLGEALKVDPIFRPSLLRLSRVEWQGASGRE